MTVDLEQVGTFTTPQIQVASGVTVLLSEPEPEKIFIEDIATATSKLTRYTGHTRVFYSVAQHSHWVSTRVYERTGSEQMALSALLHDAAEAYIGDVSRPLKMLMEQMAPGVLKGVEARIAETIALKFGAEYPWHPLIKEMDNLALATEKRDLMPRSRAGESWPGLPRPHRERIDPWSPEDAERFFLARFDDLTGGVVCSG